MIRMPSRRFPAFVLEVIKLLTQAVNAEQFPQAPDLNSLAVPHLLSLGPLPQSSGTSLAVPLSTQV